MADGSLPLDGSRVKDVLAHSGNPAFANKPAFGPQNVRERKPFARKFRQMF